MKKIYINLLFYLVALKAVTQPSDSSGLLNGPMVGHASGREVKIWVQTYEPATTLIKYKLKNTNEYHYSKVVRTSTEEGNTATLILDEVKPNSSYTYVVWVNDQKVEPTHSQEFKTPPIYRSDRELTEFSLAFGSCVFINDSSTDATSKGGDYSIFQSIADKKPDLMFWLGDNIYLRPEDWDTNTGYVYRYTYSRQVAEMCGLLSSVSNYAIWDDHDFGPNDSDRSFINKDMSLYWFKRFWANPSYGLSGYGLPKTSGIVSSFSWGDVDFFLTDNRYFRSPQKRITGKKTVLGEAQREWLIDALKFSEANVKVVAMGSLFLSSSAYYKNQNYISNYQEERSYILSRIEAEDIKNVIFISGDKHFAELSVYNNANQHNIYEFTSSPLTAHVNKREDPNSCRIPGSHIQERNFGIIRFQGETKDERSISFALYGVNGQILFEYNVKLQ